MNVKSYILVWLFIFAWLAGIAQKSGKATEIPFLVKEVYFDFAKWDVRQDQVKTLSLVVKTLKENSVSFVSITGHTDDVDDAKSNLSLGMKRAQEVRRYLIKAGLDSTRLRVVSKGKAAPKIRKTDDSSRALNRRVVLELYANGKPPVVRDIFIILVKDSVTKKPVRSNIAVTSNFSSKDSISLVLFDTNRVKVTMRRQMPYTISVVAPGYHTRTVSVNLDAKSSSTIEVLLVPYTVEAKLDFDKIYFKPDLAEFQPTAKADLERLLVYMKTNKDKRVDIVGHINYQLHRPKMSAYDQYFFYDLSVRRAKAVVDYLINNGISKERMTYRGMSNRDMIFPNAMTTEEKLKNMRVEVLVLK